MVRDERLSEKSDLRLASRGGSTNRSKSLVYSALPTPDLDSPVGGTRRCSQTTGSSGGGAMAACVHVSDDFALGTHRNEPRASDVRLAIGVRFDVERTGLFGLGAREASHTRAYGRI